MKVTYVNHMGDDLSVVNAARVSFKKESGWKNFCVNSTDVCNQVDECPYCEKTLDHTDTKLIHYLAKHQHYSPFNHTFISLHVKAPIFVARQLVKHEYMPWNEVSRRYVDDKPEYYLPPTWRGRPNKSIKQGSVGEIKLSMYAEDGVRSPESLSEHPSLEDRYMASLKDVDALYEALLEAQVAPEQARIVLPHNLYTEWYWSGTLKAWSKMYNLRIDPHSQFETREIAKQVGEIISPLFPVSWKALTNE